MQLEEIKGVGPRTKLKLNDLGIFTVDDLVEFFPYKYVDLDAIRNLEAAAVGDYICLEMKITKINIGRPGRNRIFKANAVMQDGKNLSLIWFNQIYLSKKIKVGDEIKIFGKVSSYNKYEIVNPIFENLSEEITYLNGVLPFYRTKGRFSQKIFSNILREALKVYNSNPIINLELESKFNLISYEMALERIHMPINLKQSTDAILRVQLDKSVKLSCAYKALNINNKRAHKYSGEINRLNEFIFKLPFQLSKSQDYIVKNILSKLSKKEKLNSMIVGDVGSGKTIVGIIIAYYAKISMLQSAFIAPTEILAMQHFKYVKALAKDLNVSLLTGSTSSIEKKEIYANLKSGKVDLVIGTHALLSNLVEFENLALVIIDEQHRFGVNQRNILISKSLNADVIMLSATPIPRSLHLALFQEVDLFNMENRFDRTNVKTYFVSEERLRDMFDFIASECQKREKAFIIAPKIYEDDIEMINVESIYAFLKERYPSLKIDILHGQIDAVKRQSLLDKFKAGKLHMLISTTVIEVGVDIANVHFMAILGAERFGLATLHQLRGRIGRDGEESHCFLVAPIEAKKKLSPIIEHNNGLKIAEHDYKNRGPGMWFGQEQSGENNVNTYFDITMLTKIKEIVNHVDINAKREELIEYASSLELEKVSLT